LLVIAGRSRNAVQTLPLERVAKPPPNRNLIRMTHD